MPRLSSRPGDSDRLLNALIAFPYLKASLIKALLPVQDRLRLLIDSGAFTAWKSGKAIKLDDYCRFIEALPFTPWRYFSLDMIGDPAGTLRNYELMRKRGFTPIPVFTRGEDLSVIDDYYKTSDVVGVGGLVGTPGNKGFVNGVMKRIGKRRVHWLGFTSLPFIRAYRPYMCDTASWESGAQFATFRLYLGDGVLRVMNKNTFRSAPPREILTAIKSYGLEPMDFRTNGGWAGSLSSNRTLNAASAVRLSLDVQKHVGTLFFLALTTQHALLLLVKGYDYEQRRSS